MRGSFGKRGRADLISQKIDALWTGVGSTIFVVVGPEEYEQLVGEIDLSQSEYAEFLQ